MFSALCSCCYALQVILWVSASYSSTSSEPSGNVVWIFLALPTWNALLLPPRRNMQRGSSLQASLVIGWRESLVWQHRVAGFGAGTTHVTLLIVPACD